MSASEWAWRLCARVRSGPRPPPRAPSPWHKAQLMRNSYSPAFAALGSPARGLRSSAAQAAAAIMITIDSAVQPFRREKENSTIVSPALPPKQKMGKRIPDIITRVDENRTWLAYQV